MLCHLNCITFTLSVPLCVTRCLQFCPNFPNPPIFPICLHKKLSWCIPHPCPPAVFRIVSSDIYDASPEILDSDFLLYHPHYIIITVKNVNSIRAQWYQYSINKLELDDPRHMYSNAKSNLKASLFVFSTFWFERFFRSGNAILIFWPCCRENGFKTAQKMHQTNIWYTILGECWL